MPTVKGHSGYIEATYKVTVRPRSDGAGSTPSGSKITSSFGRRLTITYFREQTPNELELETKYGGSAEDSAEIEDLRRQLDDVPFKARNGKRG